MGSEISAFFGSIGVVGTSIAAGVCMGQVKALNDAVVETSKYTAKNFMESNVRHIGETVGMSVATSVTLGQVECVNSHLATVSLRASDKLKSTVSDVADALPVVGHLKGIYHYARGEGESGDAAMIGASRTAAVIVGGILGAGGGPAGMIAGGIAGGGVVDGAATGIDSANKGKFSPHGQIHSWNEAVNAKDSQECINGIVGVISTPIMDGLTGTVAGKSVKKAFNVEVGAIDLGVESSVELLAADNPRVNGVLRAGKPATIPGYNGVKVPGNNFFVTDVTLGKYPDIHLVPIEDIIIKDRPLPVIAERLTNVMNGMQNNTPLPPVVAEYYGPNRWVLADGNHRVEASRLLGHTHIPVCHPEIAPRFTLPPDYPRYRPPSSRK
mmetsp:Transcript_16653/g.15018  ORF Transcript_16653/g.15018 Transcript_16653/m.15018 type:complete len:383 (+) Transcript_16653:65-1213(+)